MSSVKSKTLKYLARRDYARKELREKLSQSGFPEAEINNCLDEFAEKGWQSDQRFAFAYARHRANQGYGPQRIRMELQAKGVSPDEISAALQQEEIDWQDNFRQLFLKKFQGKWSKNASEKAKQLRFFYQRGFVMDEF